jgi:hypothetical protein
MTNSIPTSVLGVFATAKAYPLTERFFSCPQAAKLLDSERFIKPILIDTTQNIAAAITLIHWNSDYTTATAAKILIAEEDLQTTQALKNLAFEIFNAQGTSKGFLYQQAILGNVGMDSYARQAEDREASGTQEHYELIKQCGNHWTISPEELEAASLEENEQPEIKLFVEEIYCHTDYYRREWVEKYQTIYCEKHPADNRSCETKKTDLCNLDTVRRMSFAEQTKFSRERICKLFPQAPDTVKNDPYFRAIILGKCPEVLEKSSPQPSHEEL